MVYASVNATLAPKEQCRNGQVNVGPAFKGGDDADGGLLPQMEQRKDHSGDKLAADIASERIFAAFQTAADGDGMAASLEQETLLPADFFIDPQGPFQKPPAAPEDNGLTQTQGQGQEEPQGAATLPAFQDGMGCPHKAAGVNGYFIRIGGDRCSQRLQAIHAGQDILAVVNTG